MAPTTHRRKRQSELQGTLGTFAGVFTPSILTILGIILFLRLGFVVGHGGLKQTLIILALANGISVLTTVSLSAIATNLRVKGGGDYYLISRTLGPEFGGAIGIVLFLAQAVSIGFYTIGFGEVIANLAPETPWLSPQLVAAFATIVLFGLAWMGADWATRFQYIVMSVLTIALLSFFTGAVLKWNTTLVIKNWLPPTEGLNFWVLFAIFFPAVTGFTQGVSMSGDLKDPGKSLPLGTFLAVGISIVIYFIAAVSFSAVLSQDVLMADYNAMNQVAAFDILITAGVIAATLSSAMASFLGAPRILQSLAGDRIFPFLLPFAKGYGFTDNPRRGVLLSAAIAFVTIGLGKLNLVAPVVSMFFLISYGLLNYATFFEGLAATPHFRPRFKWFNPWTSLAGAAACLGVMLAIDLNAGLVALSVLFAIYQYVKRTAGPARWADSRRAHHMAQVRRHLIAAAAEPDHPRDWCPQLLLFSDDPERRIILLQFAVWLKGNSGLITIVRIIAGEGFNVLKLKQQSEKELRTELETHGIQAFPLVIAVPDFNLGIHTLVQASGIGPLKANTILFNWLARKNEAPTGIRQVLYGIHLKTAFRLGCNIMVLNAPPQFLHTINVQAKEKRRIDVWWQGDATSRLMLLFAHLTTQHKLWAAAKIRVLDISSAQPTPKTIDDLGKLLNDVRIDAVPEVIAKPDGDTVAAYSSDACLVLLPLRLSGNRPLDPFGQPPDKLLTRLPATALVLAAEDIDLSAEPEAGQAGEMAAAADAFNDAISHARHLLNDAFSAAHQLREKIKALKTAQAESKDEEMVSRLKKEAKAAGEAASSAFRRSAEAAANVNELAEAAQAVGVKIPLEKASKT
jgi:amino acid transporter